MLSLCELKKALGDRLDENHEWGYELRFVNELEYCGKFLVLNKRVKSSRHFHKVKKETFACLYGSVHINRWIDGVVVPTTLNPGEVLTIDQLTEHQFVISGNSKAALLEVSTHHEDSDTYRI